MNLLGRSGTDWERIKGWGGVRELGGGGSLGGLRVEWGAVGTQVWTPPL